MFGTTQYKGQVPDYKSQALNVLRSEINLQIQNYILNKLHALRTQVYPLFIK